MKHQMTVNDRRVDALTFAEKFVLEYEFDDGESGHHAPSDFEQVMMLDMVNGLFAEEAFLVLFDANPSPSTTPAPAAPNPFHDLPTVVAEYARPGFEAFLVECVIPGNGVGAVALYAAYCQFCHRYHHRRAIQSLFTRMMSACGSDVVFGHTLFYPAIALRTAEPAQTPPLSNCGVGNLDLAPVE